MGDPAQLWAQHRDPAQIHKAPNIMERLPKPPHTSVRRALRQAWELMMLLRPND